MSLLIGADREGKIAEIAQFSADELAGKTKAELRELAKGLLTGVSRLRNAELADQLNELAEPIRRTVELRQEYLEPQFENPDLSRAESRAMYLMAQLKELVLNSSFMDIRQLDYAVLDLAAEHFAFEVSQFSPATSKYNFTQYKKLLNGLLESEKEHPRYSTLADALKIFLDQYSRLLKPMRNLVNQTTAKRVAAKGKSLQQVSDGKALVEWARNVLRNHRKERWERIGIALGLACGRRLSEIFSTGEFEVIAPYKLKFRGQLKSRHLEHQAKIYEVNTLARAADCVDAVAWLSHIGRRYPDQEVSKRHTAVPLHRAISPTGTAVTDNPLRHMPGVNFKSTRALYAVMEAKIFGDESKTMAWNISAALGHGADDSDTAQSYEVFAVKGLENLEWPE